MIDAPGKNLFGSVFYLSLMFALSACGLTDALNSRDENAYRRAPVESAPPSKPAKPKEDPLDDTVAAATDPARARAAREFRDITQTTIYYLNHAGCFFEAELDMTTLLTSYKIAGDECFESKIDSDVCRLPTDPTQIDYFDGLIGALMAPEISDDTRDKLERIREEIGHIRNVYFMVNDLKSRWPLVRIETGESHRKYELRISAPLDGSIEEDVAFIQSYIDGIGYWDIAMEHHYWAISSVKDQIEVAGIMSSWTYGNYY